MNKLFEPIKKSSFCKYKKNSILFLMFFFCFAASINAQQPIYKNSNLSPEIRAKDLVSKMTVDEKLMQLQCIWIQKSKIYNDAGEFDETKASTFLKNGLGAIGRLNENGGLTKRGHGAKAQAIQYNKIQHFFIEKTRLGIPVLAHEEALHGQQAVDATNFPVAIALASTWNENLLTDVFSNVAEEVRSRGGYQVLAPVLDIAHDPRWGRTEETLGEDAYLTTQLALAEIKGYQGEGIYLEKNKVAATLKHFGVHGQSEGGINVAPSNLDERTAREIFLKPFKACVQQGKVMNVMATYNELFGIPAHINKYLLTDILRKEWGFNGVVVSDYFAIGELSAVHKITKTTDEAGLLSFKAGMDLETPDPAGFANLKKYITAGKITIAEINEKVTRVLIEKFRVGLFDNPYVDENKAEGIVGSDQKRAIALKAAQESMVLLKNEKNVLPFDKNKIKTIAIIGPNANRCLLGTYSNFPKNTVNPLQAIKEKYGATITILYAEGVKLTDEESWFADTIHLSDNKFKMEEAIAIAKQADAVVLFVGSNEMINREAWGNNHLGDMPTLELLNGQNELINAIAALGKPTCAFVNSGTPLSISNLLEKIPAVMQCWYLGQESGYAMIDALFGEINPSGKLPITFPRTVGHIPAYYNYKPSARRGYNLGLEVSPLFAFGHGLSYTTFEYSKPILSSPTMRMNGNITVSVTLKNTGNKKGAEVVQLYIRDEYASVPRPVKELKGFKKIWLEAGQLETVTFKIDKEMLSFYDANMKWIAEPGGFEVMIGTASDKTTSIKFELQ
jgi:beta-glucosidase